MKEKVNQNGKRNTRRSHPRVKAAMTDILEKGKEHKTKIKEINMKWTKEKIDMNQFAYTKINHTVRDNVKIVTMYFIV